MKKKNYFEGWYFKLQTEAITMAFIPEVSGDRSGQLSGSLQIVMEEEAFFIEHEFPAKMEMKKGLYLVLGKNVFTDVCIHLDIDEENIKIKGDVYFDDIGAKFNVMGPLNYIPMQCKHGILSMEQRLSGKLSVNDKEINFDGGKGYLETDYGHSFPSTYLWSQCNWFDEGECRIAMAAATLPFGRHKVMGTFICIDYLGKKYKFATYKGAEVLGISSSGFTINEGPYTFEGRREGGVPVELKSPENGEMNGVTKEYLRCTMEYTLKKRGEEIFSLKSDKASFEYL